MENNQDLEKKRNETLEDCEERMRKLEASQNIIVETSDFLLKLASQDPTFIDEVVKLWCKFLLRVHKNKKVAFVYLANDLIQKSLISVSKNKSPATMNYQKAFEPVIGHVLIKLFETLSKSEYQQIKVDVLKVLRVWIQRSVYDPDQLTLIKNQLMEIGQLTEEDLEQKTKPTTSAESNNKKDVKIKNQLTLDELRGGYEIASEWIEMSESLKFIEENRQKIKRLEEGIEEMINQLDKADEIDLECKINEYKNQIQLQRTYERDLLKQPLRMYNKLENANVQSVLTLNRIDETINKAIRLKLNFRK